MIQVSELHFSTEEGIKVLEDVHLRVDQGEMVFLVGPQAAGKSVLLGLLAARIPPQRGQILVNGRNVARLSKRKAAEFRRKIGFFPQRFVPLPKTVLENVTFKLRALGNFREQAEEKALAALDQVGLTAKLASLGNELEPVDRVKLGLALALCDEPLLLLCDEPFEDLGEEERSEIASLLARVHSRGLTGLVASRGPIPDSLSDYRTVSLVDGKVVEP